jgi:hypothetical protein
MRLERRKTRVLVVENCEGGGDESDLSGTLFLLVFVIFTNVCEWVQTHRFLLLVSLVLLVSTSDSKCQMTEVSTAPASTVEKQAQVTRNTKIDLAFCTELLESELRRPPEKWDYGFLAQHLRFCERIEGKRNRHQKMVVETTQRALGVYQYPVRASKK